MWNLNDEASTPPLPAKILTKPRRGVQAEQVSSPLQKGCWLVQLIPLFSDDYDPRRAIYPYLRGWTVRYMGTLRVELCDTSAATDRVDTPETGGLRASGDLYIHHSNWEFPGSLNPPSLEKPQSDGIPIFSRKDYAFYFTVQDIAGGAKELVLTLAVSLFDAGAGSWGAPQTLTARLNSPESLPGGWTDPQQYFAGSVRNEHGMEVAKMQMGWISPFLREARFAIAAGPDLAATLAVSARDAAVSVESVFAAFDWKFQIAGAPTVVNVTASVWPAKDLHAAMLAMQSAVDYDQEWRYNALVVSRIFDSVEYGFSMMYDGDSLDTDLVPRDGIVIAAESRFPSEDRFGRAKGKMLKEAPEAAFCDFMHELGHAMGLVHRFHGTGFMQELVYFASPDAITQKAFPDNLGFQFDPLDELRLRHFPDPWVRPGGVPFGTGFTPAPVPEDHLTTDVSALMPLSAAPLDQFPPLGAPVRLQIRLTNQTDRTLPGPACLSLAKGSVSGRVIAPNGTVRAFSAASPLDYLLPANLAPGHSLFHGETLWRGPDGALFPAPGLYRIELTAGWEAPGGVATAKASCNVLITAPRNRCHEEAALRLLACEDIMVLLVFRASPDGNTDAVNWRIAAAAEVLQECLTVEELRPSLAPIQARLIAGRHLDKAARLLDDDSQLSTSEIENFLRLVRKAKPELGGSSPQGDVVATCRRKLRQAVRAGFIDRNELGRILTSKESS